MKISTEFIKIDNKTIACKKTAVEDDNTVSIDRFYVYYTEDPTELSTIKELVGVKAYYEIILIWNK